MTKINPDDKVSDIMIKMCEGNPGALTCLMKIMEKSDWKRLDSVMMVILIDDIGLYGSKLYMVWNDCCDKDLNKMELVIDSYRRRVLSKGEIISKVSSGRGTPFEGLSWED